MIYVINRHCKFSNLSAGKPRPSFFSREKCLINLWKTSRDYQIQGTIKSHYLFDGDMTDHFLLNHVDKKRIIQLNSGSGAKSFVDAVDYALNLNCDPEDIIYLLEDDYLHRPNWPSIIEEGLNIEDSSWISLYDHGDKYYRCLPVNLKPYYQQYQDYTSQVTYTRSSYWRTACSTTDTFAIKYNELNKISHCFSLQPYPFHEPNITILRGVH